MPRTALIVPVREASAYYDKGNGVPAHVTVLFPFLEAADVDEAALRDLLGRFRAFDFVLDRLEHFEDGTAWLRPNPSARFEDLTAAVWERWPDHPPYEGAYDEPIPHLTVTREDAQLPIASRATEVLLIGEEPGGRWATRLSIPLS
jgi:2'-5' RNA ligase superfamily